MVTVGDFRSAATWPLAVPRETYAVIAPPSAGVMTALVTTPDGEEAAGMLEAAPAAFPVFRSRFIAAVLARTYA